MSQTRASSDDPIRVWRAPEAPKPNTDEARAVVGPYHELEAVAKKLLAERDTFKRNRRNPITDLKFI